MLKLLELNHFRGGFEPLRPSVNAAYGTQFHQFKLVCTGSFSLWLQEKQYINLLLSKYRIYSSFLKNKKSKL